MLMPLPRALKGRFPHSPGLSHLQRGRLLVAVLGLQAPSPSTLSTHTPWAPGYPDGTSRGTPHLSHGPDQPSPATVTHTAPAFKPLKSLEMSTIAILQTPC